MEFKRENIIGYVNSETSVPRKNALWGSLTVMLMVCIPSALFGVYANITRIVLIPIIGIFCIWIFYLLVNIESKKNQYTLFLGNFSVFISLSYILAAYKVAASAVDVPMVYIFVTLIAYVLTNVVSIINIIRLLNRGYYNLPHKAENPMGIIFAMSILGLGIGRVMVGKVSQDIAVTILVTCLMFMGFLHAIGTHNLLKYYFAKKYIG
ncbi:MAG: hypothetical protein ACYCYE_19145 [Clostridia bacterium]